MSNTDKDSIKMELRNKAPFSLERAVYDNQLSAKSMGYLAMIIFHSRYAPNQGIESEVLLESKKDSRTALTSALKELEDRGYIVRKDYRVNGKFQTKYTTVF